MSLDWKLVVQKIRSCTELTPTLGTALWSLQNGSVEAASREVSSICGQHGIGTCWGICAQRGSVGIHQVSSSEQSGYRTAAVPGPLTFGKFYEAGPASQSVLCPVAQGPGSAGLCTCFNALLLPFYNSWDSRIRRACTFISFDLWKLCSQFHCNLVIIPQAKALTFHTD